MYADDRMITKLSDVDARALAAKESDREMESMLADFRPFFAHTATKYAIRTNQDHKDELFNVAQIGFYNAINKFDIAKGHFFPFARLVVQNSIVDYIRSVFRKNTDTVSFEVELGADGKPLTRLLEKVSIERYDSEMRQKRLIEELSQFRSELAGWKISMEALVKESPKHAAVKTVYKGIVQMILETPHILDTILIKRYLPIKEISKISGLPQKKIERARTFILAAILIKIGDYVYLSDYVEGWGSNESNNT